jgi:hypothetical protein
MLVTFKSKAAADVLMYEEHAKPILALFGKDVTRGVITAAETAHAVAQLEAAIEESRRRAAPEEDGENSEEREPAARRGVTFSARAYPLLEMLRAAQKNGKDVIWGA